MASENMAITIMANVAVTDPCLYLFLFLTFEEISVLVPLRGLSPSLPPHKHP